MAEPRSEATLIMGQRLREARTEIGFSQMDVAEITGIHFTNIAKIERGEANPSLITIIRIADALDINPSRLVDGLGTQHVPGMETNRDAKLRIREKIRDRHR